MFRSALLAVKPSTKKESSFVQSAMDLTRRYQWRVTAFTVVDAGRVVPLEAVPLGAGAFKHELDQHRLEAARQAAGQALAACQLAGTAAQQQVRTLLVEGDTVQQIARQSAEHDVLVVGHCGDDELSDVSLLFRILEHSPRPAIVLPPNSPPREPVVVAYDGSFQAMRMLATFAHSGLANGRPVHVLTCHADPATGKQIAESARLFFQSHGITADLHVETGEPFPAILALVDSLQAGLLAMGAFGKHKVREFLFGSVTKNLLRDLPLPVFLDH